MRLSEAIRLGSLAIQKPHAGDTRVCAIGMGLEAIGQRTVLGHLYDNANYKAIAANWPWTQKRESENYFQYVLRLAYLFDDEVCPFHREPTVTLEQLCDQVAIWERDCAAKGINVEQVAMAATPETTHEPAAEHIEKVSA